MAHPTFTFSTFIVPSAATVESRSSRPASRLSTDAVSNNTFMVSSASSSSAQPSPSAPYGDARVMEWYNRPAGIASTAALLQLPRSTALAAASAAAAAAASAGMSVSSITSSPCSNRSGSAEARTPVRVEVPVSEAPSTASADAAAAAAATPPSPHVVAAAGASPHVALHRASHLGLSPHQTHTHPQHPAHLLHATPLCSEASLQSQSAGSSSATAHTTTSSSTRGSGGGGATATIYKRPPSFVRRSSSGSGTTHVHHVQPSPTSSESLKLPSPSAPAVMKSPPRTVSAAATAPPPPTQSEPQLSKRQAGPARTSPRAADAIHTAAGPAGAQQTRLGTPLPPPISAHTPSMSVRQYSCAQLESPMASIPASDLSNTAEGVDWSWADTDPREVWRQRVELHRVRTPAPPLSPRPPPPQQQQQSWLAPQQLQPTFSADDVDARSSSARPSEASGSLQLPLAAVLAASVKSTPPPDEGSSATPSSYAPSAPAPQPPPAHAAALDETDDMGDDEEESALTDMNIFVAVRVRPLNTVLAREVAAAAAAAAATIGHTDDELASRTLFSQQHLRAEDSCELADAECETSRTAFSVLSESQTRPRAHSGNSSSTAAPRARNGSQVRPQRSHNGSHVAVEGDADGLAAAKGQHRCIQPDARNGFVDCTVGVSGNTLASSCGSSTASVAAALSSTSITSDALLSGRRVTTRRFYYDHILDETMTQADVMARIGRRAVRRVLQGYHGTVMCYGQSGSGKTYTTVGPHGGKLSRTALEWMTSAGPMADGSTAAKQDEVDDGDELHAGKAGGVDAHVRAAAASMGLLPRMLVALFHGLEARHPTSTTAAPPTSTWRMSISALELYNEELRDLLPHDIHLKRTGADGDAGRRDHRHHQKQRRQRHRSSSSSSSGSGSDDDGRLEQEADGDRAATPSPEPVDSATGARGKRASASTKAASRRGADHRGALNAASDAHDETSSDSSTRLHQGDGDQEVHHDPHDAVPTLSRQTVNGVETASECSESHVRRDRSESPAPQPGNTPMRTRVSQRVGNGGLSYKRGSSIAVPPGGAASGATALARQSSKSPTPRARGASAANMWAAPPSSAATPVASLQIRQTAAAASAVAPSAASTSAAAAGGAHGGRGGSPRPTAAASGGARRQAGTEAVYIDGLREHEVLDVHEAMELVRQALRHRQMGSTKLNKDSSRSHTFFFVRVEQQWQRTSAADGAGGAADAAAAATTTRCCDIRRSTLTLVDLAGSERVSHTGAHGLRLKEAQNINLSLSALGNVMRLLSAAAAGAGGAIPAGNTSTTATPRGATAAAAAADVHVPYRDSKLTRILQSSLGGNAITFLLCNVSPERRDALETMSTLRFAKLAKTVKNRVHLNETTTADALTEALAAARAEAAAAATERHAILLAVATAQAKIHELVTDGTQARDRLRQLATYAWWLEGHLSHFAAAAYEQQQQQHRQHQQQRRGDEYDNADAGRAMWRSSTTTVASVAVTTPGRAGGDATSRGLVIPGEAAAPQVLFTEDCLSARKGLTGSQVLMPRFTEVCDSVTRDEQRSVSESGGPAAPEWWCVSPRPPSPSAAAQGDAPHAAADAAAVRAYWHSAPARAFLSSAHSIVERRHELQRRLIAAAAAVSASPSTAMPFASTVGRQQQQQQQVPSADRVMTPGRWSDVRQHHPATAAGATPAPTALALPIATTEVPPSPSGAAAAAAASVATNPLDGAPHSPNGSVSRGRHEAGDSACDPDANDVTVAAVDSGVCSGHAPSTPLRGDNGARRGRGSLASAQGSVAVFGVSDLSPPGSTRSRRASDTTQDGERWGTPGDAPDQRGGDNAESSLCAVATLSSAPLLFGSPRQDAPARLYPPGLDAAAALADERSAHAASQARLQQLEEVNVLLRLRLAEMQRRLREGGGSTDAGGADAQEASPHAASCAAPPTAPAPWPPHYTRAASDASLEVFLARCGFAPLQTDASTTASAAAASSPSRAAAAREQALHLRPVPIRRRRNSSSLRRISVDPSSVAALRRGSGGQQPTWTGSEDYHSNTSHSGFVFNAASSGAFAGSRVDASTGMTPSPTASSVRSRSHRTRSSISSARSGSNSNSNSCLRSTNRELDAANKTSRVIKSRKPRLPPPPPVPLVIVDDLPSSTLSSARAEAYTDVARAIAAAAAALRGSAQGGRASSFEDDDDHLSLAYRSPNTMDQLSHSIYSVGGDSSFSGGSDSAAGRRRWGAHLLDTLRATLALVRAFRKREDFLELEDLSSFSIE